MCLTITAGRTKYLGCGHISNPTVFEEDCRSSQCLRSQYHSNIGCSHGWQANCLACAQGAGACPRHHSCRSNLGMHERVEKHALGLCTNCIGRRRFVVPDVSLRRIWRTSRTRWNDIATMLKAAYRNHKALPFFFHYILDFLVYAVLTSEDHSTQANITRLYHPLPFRPQDVIDFIWGVPLIFFD